MHSHWAEHSIGCELYQPKKEIRFGKRSEKDKQIDEQVIKDVGNPDAWGKPIHVKHKRKEKHESN